MKVLFLDIDGVLNTRNGSMDTDKVELLRDIIARTGAGVVLSSTWRKTEHMRARVKTMLESIGARYLGRTQVMEYQEHGLWRAEPRGHEIKAWLEERPWARKFVILDDDPNMVTLMPFLVRTDSLKGLTPELADEVVRRLNTE